MVVAGVVLRQARDLPFDAVPISPVIGSDASDRAIFGMLKDFQLRFRPTISIFKQS
jgi:hypothetical protein